MAEFPESLCHAVDVSSDETKQSVSCIYVGDLDLLHQVNNLAQIRVIFFALSLSFPGVVPLLQRLFLDGIHELSASALVCPSVVPVLE